ncbi:MAG: rhodanese-like domain-containing protein [Bacteroidia bacterium]|nr:rhodanese-like domain-containing protein [Bacteroidia bacterium]MCZ2278352.1 rhodanese-like domain-containing protein [Bacteroidia bacterium]
MSKKSITSFIFIAAFMATAFFLFTGRHQGGTEPWTENQLMQPAELAGQLTSGQPQQIYIFNIGPAGLIQGAVQIGETGNQRNLSNLRLQLEKLPKEANIVIYCGCCPFKNCPNIRPAFSLLNEMKFTNHKLLNLADNLKTDWIDKGYPLQSPK